jgi:hypothetical protein
MEEIFHSRSSHPLKIRADIYNKEWPYPSPVQTGLAVLFRHILRFLPGWERWSSAGSTFSFVSSTCDVNRYGGKTSYVLELSLLEPMSLGGRASQPTKLYLFIVSNLGSKVGFACIAL